MTGIFKRSVPIELPVRRTPIRELKASAPSMSGMEGVEVELTLLGWPERLPRFTSLCLAYLEKQSTIVMVVALIARRWGCGLITSWSWPCPSSPGRATLRLRDSDRETRD